jgi:hypothetical protein
MQVNPHSFTQTAEGAALPSPHPFQRDIDASMQQVAVLAKAFDVIFSTIEPGK